MSDLIDRQAAIDAVLEMLRKHEMDDVILLDEQESSSAPTERTYEDGWREGREALRREIWEDERERLD